MKFEDAFDKVHDMFPDGARPKGDPNYPRMLAFLWSMQALAFKEAGIKNVLDDIAFIGLDMQVVSKPLYEPMSTQNDGAEDSKPAKKSKKGGSEETVTDDDSKSA